MVKKADKFNTLLLPIIITFALNFTLGATYSFSLVLFFIVILFVFLFNLCELHKKIFDHKVFIAFFDNIWLMASFFWFVNIWVTVNYPQPYFMLEVWVKNWNYKIWSFITTNKSIYDDQVYSFNFFSVILKKIIDIYQEKLRK